MSRIFFLLFSFVRWAHARDYRFEEPNRNALASLFLASNPVRPSPAHVAVKRYGKRQLARPVMQWQKHVDLSDFDPMEPGTAPLGKYLHEREEGMHTTGNRYFEVRRFIEEMTTGIFCIAGAYPGLTVEQLQRPQPLPFAPAGEWNYHVLSAEAAPGGIVALPNVPRLSAYPDTVAVVCSGKSVGISFADHIDREVIALVDRSDAATTDANQMDPKKFYLFVDPQGVITIRWYDEMPAGHRIAGRVIYVYMKELVDPTKGGKQGIAELNNDFVF